MYLKIIILGINVLLNRRLMKVLSAPDTGGVNSIIAVLTKCNRLQSSVITFGARISRNPLCRFVYWCDTGRSIPGK
jgi:hypothetical protein